MNKKNMFSYRLKIKIFYYIENFDFMNRFYKI